MESKVQEINGISIDYSTSSVEIFPAIKELAGSEHLYIKFSKNRIRFLDEQKTELQMDFDLCLIDRSRNETVMQLFAIFLLTKDQGPVTDLTYIEQAVEFGKSLLEEAIAENQCKDNKGQPIILPAFVITPGSMHLFE